MSCINSEDACSASANEPVGTSSLAAATCNLSYFDRFINSTELTDTNRVGTESDTVTGRLLRLGFTAPVDYASGVSFSSSDHFKTIERNGIVYAPLPSSLPFTTTGTWGAIGVGGDNTDFYVIQITGNSFFSTPFSFTATEGQTVFTLPAEFGDNPTVNSLFIDTGYQDRVGNAQSPAAYSVAGNVITLSEGVKAFQLVTGVANQLATTGPAQPVAPVEPEIGTIGNPFQFDTLFDFVNSLPMPAMFLNEQWIQFNGRTIRGDGNTSKYQVTNVAPTIRHNYENYIPLDVDGAGASLWAVLIEGFKRDFYAQATEIIAHRGFNDGGPQNTLANYGNAVRYQCDGLETDWQVSSDGVPVMYHDIQGLEEDTNGTGLIKDNTIATLRGLEFTELSGGFWADKIRISLVSDFFKFAVRHNQRVYIEIKDFRTIADIKLLTDLIASYNYESMTSIISFNIDDLVEARRLNKRVGVGWLTTNINSVQEDIDFDKLQKLKYADALIVDIIMVAFPAVQQKCYDAGIGVAAWGIQYTVDFEDILGVNVPRVITDLPNNPTFKRGLQNVNY